MGVGVAGGGGRECRGGGGVGWGGGGEVVADCPGCPSSQPPSPAAYFP